MIPKEITPQLVRLKEKTKNYSAISRSYKIDEIRSDVAIINDEITGLNRDINNIIVDGLGSKIEIENWFEGLMDRSEFIEPNPRLIYEEEQREIEHQKKLSEEKKQKELEELQKRQKQDRIDAFRKLLVYGPEDFQKIKDFISDGFNINDDLPEVGLNWLLNYGRSLPFIELLIDAGMKITANDRIELERQKGIAREREKQKKLEAENDAWEAEERQTRLRAQQRIEEFKKICLDKKSEEIDQLHKLIENGLDVNCINDFDGLTKIVFWNKSLSFIKILVDSGLYITKKNVRELYSKYEHRYNQAELLNLLISTKNIDPDALKIIKETIANQKKAEPELQQKKEQQRKLSYVRKSQIAEFRFLCYNGPDDINKVQQLINDGLDIKDKTAFYSIATCIARKRSIEFIRFLIDAGMYISKSDIESCHKNSSNPRDIELNKILITAKNIDKNAFEIVQQIKNAEEIKSASISPAEFPKSSIIKKVNQKNSDARKSSKTKKHDLIFWLVIVLIV